MIEALSFTPTTTVARVTNSRRMRAPASFSIGHLSGDKYELKARSKEFQRRGPISIFIRDHSAAKPERGLRTKVSRLKIAPCWRIVFRNSRRSLAKTFRARHTGAVIESSPK